MEKRLGQSEVPELAQQLWTTIAEVVCIKPPPASTPESLMRIWTQGQGVREANLWAPWAPLESVPAIRIEGAPGGEISIVHLPLGREKLEVKETDALPYWEASFEGFRIGNWYRQGGSPRIKWATSDKVLDTELKPSDPLLRRFHLAYLWSIGICIGGRPIRLSDFGQKNMLEETCPDNLRDRLLLLGREGVRVTGPLTTKGAPWPFDKRFLEVTLVVNVKVSLADGSSTSIWPLTLRRWFLSSMLRDLARIPKS